MKTAAPIKDGKFVNKRKENEQRMGQAYFSAHGGTRKKLLERKKNESRGRSSSRPKKD